MTRLWCEQAWLPAGPTPGVAIDVVDGRIAALTPASPREGTVLAGLTVPGLRNRHSHAFHRALRGRSSSAGSFWTWREGMYTVAAALDPERYRRLAAAVYAEMVLAGFTAVTEFHYLHHRGDGTPHTDHPRGGVNAMARALVDAATDAGIRITLLDTCYLAGGIHEPLAAAQRRFGDADATAWARRADLLAALDDGDRVRVGAAVHSVRAVPREALPTVAAWARGRPLHVHLSEQPAENAACLEAYGATPTAVLDDAGVLGPDTTVVHATHLVDDDVARLARAGARACFCPTTERDLGDGIGPASALAGAGVALCLGSDSHAVIDPFEEMRALEMHERLAHGVRGRFTPAQLLAAGTDGATIAVGAPADLVTVDIRSIRTAGAAHGEVLPGGVLLAASAADVRDVHVGGRAVVRGGVHQLLDRPAERLAAAIEAVSA